MQEIRYEASLLSLISSVGNTNSDTRQTRGRRYATKQLSISQNPAWSLEIQTIRAGQPTAAILFTKLNRPPWIFSVRTERLSGPPDLKPTSRPQRGSAAKSTGNAFSLAFQ